jgi:acyl-lipid omega-6 desaturase (Delta-12 desaturase)
MASNVGPAPISASLQMGSPDDAKGLSSSEAQKLVRALSRYAEPCYWRGTFELVVTAVPFVLGWLLVWATIHINFIVSLPLMILTAGFLVRLFLIQHDCGHGAFFPGRRSNDWVGRVIGVATLTPYYVWRRNHAVHHATSANLSRRGTGDVATLTVKEYIALSQTGRRLYRIYRHPLVMFGFGPFYLFYVQQRLPLGLTGEGYRPWLSSIANNVAIVATFAVMMWLVGAGNFLIVHVPITLIAGLIGVWLFYVQHQFEHTNWFDNDQWAFSTAALYGSVYYDLPPVLRWFTANNGVHHLHHLQCSVPFYRYREVLRDYPELTSIGRITLLQSFRCTRLALWDESLRKLVTFGEAHERYRGEL